MTDSSQHHETRQPVPFDKAALKEAVSVSHDSESQTLQTQIVGLDLVQSLRSEVDDNALPGFLRLIFLTSNHSHSAPAHSLTTCEDYAVEKWGQTGLFVLKSVYQSFRQAFITESPKGSAAAVDTTEHGTGKPEESSSLRLTIDWNDAEGPQVLISDVASEAELLNVCEQLCWMVSVFRPDSNRSVAYSQIRTHCRSLDGFPARNKLVIELLEPVDVSSTGISPGWLPMFRGTHVACGFSAPDSARTQSEQGAALDIPFAAMATVAGIKYPLPCGKGIILRGPCSLLYLVKQTSQNTVKWRLLQSPIGSDLEIPEIKEHLVRTQWAKTLDLDFLVLSKALLE